MLRVGRTIGKYRILRRLGTGGFAEVYKARDTIEGVLVALKAPHPQFLSPHTLDDFRREIRLMASLDHPHILSIKNADLYDGQLVVAYPLGDETLADRLTRRMAAQTCLEFGLHLLEGLAHAHSRRIIHCDVKPENLILFPDNALRLTDFGIAKVAHRTMSASGSGTVGYVAPEQAMGRPSFRSDVFSAGLVLYRMLSGELPEWPFSWPLPGLARVKAKAPAAMVELLRRALQIDHRKRFRDAGAMLAAYRRQLAKRRPRRSAPRPPPRAPDWPQLRWREFTKRYRGVFKLDTSCGRCRGPVAEVMQVCPWCGTKRRRHRGRTDYPARCTRCGRGRKLDWKFCAWCHGPAFRKVSSRAYSDRRYQGRCANAGCARKALMSFSRYCPWCRRKVQRKWALRDGKRCTRCGWGVVRAYWDHCPWCGLTLRRGRTTR